MVRRCRAVLHFATMSAFWRFHALGHSMACTWSYFDHNLPYHSKSQSQQLVIARIGTKFGKTGNWKQNIVEIEWKDKFGSKKLVFSCNSTFEVWRQLNSCARIVKEVEPREQLVFLLRLQIGRTNPLNSRSGNGSLFIWTYAKLTFWDSPNACTPWIQGHWFHMPTSFPTRMIYELIFMRLWWMFIVFSHPDCG